MQIDHPLFEDFAKLAGNALGVASDVKREFEAGLNAALSKALTRMDLVSREEFEAIRAMLAAAREEQEGLKKRMDELEAMLKKTA
ncbi:MAG: accessory factor UbiK family protein [Alphaproteobacteria bacterium]|nr:accessory factor UbiK family protein [Alphaproteobacteria bacterium]